MAFAAATVVTILGKAIFADRVRTTPATYTVSPKFIAMGTGATAAARTASSADTVLSTEVETRTSGTESTVTTTNANDTYQVTGTVTASVARAVDECGLFTSGTTSAPSMFLSVTQLVDNLLSGDSIAFTFKVQQI
jgi:hypothetical protein